MEFRNCCKLNAPVIIQFSNGGAQLMLVGLSNENETAIAGGIAGANTFIL
jgi:fructose-bisphosphate aldolase class II